MQEPVARVLLIGGELADYSRLGSMLDDNQQGAYQLLWCERLEKSSDEIYAGNYDLALLSCHLEADAALELLQQLVTDHGNLPIIALTEQVDCIAAAQAVQIGAVDYLALQNLNSYVLQHSITHVIDKNAVNKLPSQLNHYDSLTGIPNRILFFQILERSIKEAKEQQINSVLLLINLDGFKKVNESYGSEVGDRIVATMAQRLSRCVRKTDYIARIGGDEFSLILDDCHNNNDVALVAKNVIENLSAPFVVEDQPLMISCSIGIASYPEAGDSVDELLKCTNMALLEAKSQRGSQYCFYSEETNADSMRRLDLEADLRLALRRNDFEMYYQPKIAIESGVAVGMEALIRWRHPDQGMISPKEFIPIAEECGLIVPIGYWVIHQVCQDLKTFDTNEQGGGLGGMDVAINLSFKQLQDNMFVDTATRIIKQSGVDASRLEFELTETAIMSNYQQTYDGMMALSKLGVTFSLDDFGTGYSSFAHIQRLPISALKVDRSFIRNVVNNNEDAIIVKAIINLAHNLHLKVIAEGVETLEQVQFLWQNHCDQIQGFYFSPAVAAADINRMITQRVMVAM